MVVVRMDDQNKNLILATALSFFVILGWYVGGPILFPSWFPEEVVQPTGTATTAVVPSAATPPVATDGAAGSATLTAAAAPEAPRLSIDTDELSGSISLLGGRIDDLSLKTYTETVKAGSPNVRLLSPVGQASPFYALFGWQPAGDLTFDDVPGANTEWQLASGSTLSPDAPVTLTWDNGKGLAFTRTVAVDDKFMFNVTDSVTNSGGTEARLAPYGVIARHGLPTSLQNIWVVHEGLIGRTDGILDIVKYKSVPGLPVVENEGAHAQLIEAKTDGWIGFTDHYFMTILVPEAGKPFTAVTKYTQASDVYQTETRQPVLSVAPGATAKSTTQLFAGAKEWETIRGYQNEGVAGFVDSIDWGWFYFLTKPIFSVLHWLNKLIGNMGLAIIGLTFVLKLLVLPLAYKSYVSMARMKELQPEMEALKERTGDDKQKMQKEMMQLYKEKKVNPAAGCLPILIQIPIFFSLYKVIFVTIELRHAPFFGWLNDLSGPDTSTIYNLFGLLPWPGPEVGSILALIFIGILPILLGITMWMQQKLNPAPPDPIQQQIFAYMPWIFMFMLGSFASGLVVYWITNNIITFGQQYIIMRSHGHKPDIFGNITSGYKKKPISVVSLAKPPTKTSGKGKK
jgi:YidC/Oxa1 family membrane protein insertase